MNNISFQGTTSFTISPTAYQKVAATTRRAYTNLDKTHNCQLEKHKLCTLDTDLEYLTVIVRNDENKGIFRYIPIKQKIESYTEDLSNQVENLERSAKGKSLTAWIIGGTRLNSERGNLISDTLNKIAAIICDKKNIDTSILVGSTTGEEKFIIRAGFSDFRLSFDKNVNSTNNLEEELSKIFDIVELNKTNLSYEK